MKIKSIVSIIDKGNFSRSNTYKRLEKDVIEGIMSIENPPGTGKFILYNEPKRNGVKPIKNAFISKLNNLGWTDEKKVIDPAIKKRRIDSSIEIYTGRYFGVEWETGNISSSHRAINRLLLGMLEDVLIGGFLVLPSRDMYKYLTDRIGNFKELSPYIKLWKELNNTFQNNVLKIIEIEHDGVSKKVPPFKKGTDGRSMI